MKNSTKAQRRGLEVVRVTWILCGGNTNTAGKVISTPWERKMGSGARPVEVIEETEKTIKFRQPAQRMPTDSAGRKSTKAPYEEASPCWTIPADEFRAMEMATR